MSLMQLEELVVIGEPGPRSMHISMQPNQGISMDSRSGTVWLVLQLLEKTWDI